jgi:hypothetical protein
MKSVSIFGTIALLISCTGFKAPVAPQPPEAIAVIELFTSQGCSSCPPADQLLSQTIADAKKEGRKIFALSFHVDYWNRLGWSDPFSDKKYSERQSLYAAHLSPGNIYTPQMIVNGSSELVGSDKSALRNALSQALSTSTTIAFKNLSVTQPSGNSLHADYELGGDYSNCSVNFALVSLSETTSVKRGENEGRTLTNENVVRQFITMKAAGNGEIDFASSPVPVAGNVSVIAFVQHNADLKIVGAAMAELN